MRKNIIILSLIVLFAFFVSGPLISQRQPVQIPPPDTTNTIKVSSPAYCSDITGKTIVKFFAPNATTATVKCWIGGGQWGHDSIFPIVKLNKKGEGEFMFPAKRFPHGPTCIRISTGKDICHLQVYNTVGVKWKEGIPAPPPQAKGMTLAFQDDFSGPLSISATGVGKTYSSRHIDGSFGRIPFADYESEKNPFAQRDTYLRIRVDGNKNSAGLISSRRSDSTYSCAVKFGYFECRFVAPMFEGSWPAFWGCTARARSANNKYCAELDIIEAYGNFPDQYETTWHLWEQKHTGNPVTKVKMTELGGKANWSTTAHIYGVLIRKDSTIYYLDNIEVWRHATIPYTDTKPFYFMINLAVNVNKTRPLYLKRYDNIADMYVDYVRVFQDPSGLN